MKSRLTFLVLTLVLAACGPDKTNSESAPQVAAAPEPVDYAGALANPSRLEGDYARDAGRKPGQVLAFLGVERGMDVLDLFSGGGYYTEILSQVVGKDGHVVSHSNEAYLNFVGEEFTLRHAEGRLPNVDVLMAENNELQLNESEFDAILLVLSFHDTYFANPNSGWDKIDVPKLLAELHKGLKEDGFVGIVDHYAEAGSPRETGGTLHRIDPQIVIAEMKAAGFVCVDKSDLLRNLNDDYSSNVFGPEVRGKTDRFILRFKKAG